MMGFVGRLLGTLVLLYAGVYFFASGNFIFGLACWIGCLVFIYTPIATETRSFQTRAEGHRDIRYLLGELTEEESRKEEESDRQHFNETQYRLALWTNAYFYIDYDGRKIRMT